MTVIDVDALHALLQSRLNAAMTAQVKIAVVGESGLQIRIEGEKCLTSIGVWPNGCCDVDFLYVSSGQGQFSHFEFASAEEALRPVMSEIQAALERGQ
jgi:hypothetical protein